MPAHRIARGKFYAKLVGLNHQRLKKVLLTPYWRGLADMRQRIDAQLDPKEASLARPLAGMLEAPDHWAGFTGQYLGALDAVADHGSERRGPHWPPDQARQARARALAHAPPLPSLGRWRGR